MQKVISKILNLFRKTLVNKNRKLNFEILRIVSMFLIIAHHYAIYLETSEFLIDDIGYLIVNFFKVGGKLGVILFVLITGYFGIEQQFSIKKTWKIVLKIEFYSYAFLAIALVSQMNLSLKLLISSFFPISCNLYWFATSYIILYILTPFINTLLKKLEQKEFSKLIIILTILMVFIPSISLSDLSIGETGKLIYIYILGAYIKTKEKNIFSKNWYNILIALISYLLAFLFTIGLAEISAKISFLVDKKHHFISLSSIFLYISAIGFFEYFKNLKISNCFAKKILFFSTSTFGVYLIHENKIFNTFLWKILSFEFLLKNPLFLIFQVILIIIWVYILCSIIDKLYQLIFEKKLLNIIEKIQIFLTKKIIKYYGKKE